MARELALPGPACPQKRVVLTLRRALPATQRRILNHKDTKFTKFKTVRRVFFENRATVFKKAAFSFAVFPANEKPKPFVLSSFVS
ncbi:hypothetical protein, partial [Desulfonatronospira sp.]|uniref:hypothetical protein n=1 Tax=Desulfonatronospira sp. TaxID=1962951 RepID=UPI0025BB2C09